MALKRNYSCLEWYLLGVLGKKNEKSRKLNQLKQKNKVSKPNFEIIQVSEPTWENRVMLWFLILKNYDFF